MQNTCIHTRRCTRVETEKGTRQNNQNLKLDLSKYVLVFSNIYKLFFVGFGFGGFFCLFFMKLSIPITFTCFDHDLL